ncbi:MAG: polymer-forming cytoskeletal protein [Pseudomonadales bacterium]|jgi:cytoskeletal protein CcmA (bactofilin family)|nr:polymer-forming cytoskeletal protein [Pseudomonadales bacterium]MDP6970042.1 polymer-forming cytoskeletal protein [Pseudomonadales bacterium]|tara:strand:+ start:310 stop:711 length:402 start_codon:yes stop_codon:yes gene_type:complete
MKKSRLEKGVTLIAAHTRITGDVDFTDQLYVNGAIIGNITASSDDKAVLVISEDGSITGEVRVPKVVVNGTVEGNVYAGERAELAPKARVIGTVYYKLIEMQLGAMVDGQMVHQDDPGAEVHQLHADPSRESS